MMRAVLTAIALLVVGVVGGLIGLVLVKGLPGVSGSLLWSAAERLGEAGGLRPVLTSTVVIVGGAILLVVPIGLSAATWLQEYAPPSLWVEQVRRLIEALAGIPSVLYGLFGFSLFAVGLGWGWSHLTAMATLALMLLPMVIQTGAEALRTVPDELREGARALGATRWETVRYSLFPAAAPGIVTGVLLALGRALGESAAVLLTAGGDLRQPQSLLDQGRPLAAHLYHLTILDADPNRIWATAAVLVGLVLIVQLTASWLGARLQR
ncbi:MAG TPA: phosphate ABC transporter permease PstA [Symbiobacteriaceae bacterium]|nr:phosphate ABC transporter permease PstA [Symbiobacteriaceae bacterium]